MSGIFPPLDKGGKPPGGNVCNGFSPTHPVIGEGPLYFGNDCATTLPDCAMNSVLSELLALKDIGLDIPWNANRVDNLGAGLRDVIAAIYRAIDLKVDRAGDTMEGPLFLARDPQTPLEAATRRWVEDQISALNTALRAFVDGEVAAITAAYSAMIALVDERKINRSGDTMTGPLILARQPVLSMEATTKYYVDTTGGGGGPGGGDVQEAPYDDTLYGRMNASWVRIIDDGEYT